MTVWRDAWRAVARRATATSGIALVAGLGGGLLVTVFAAADPILFRPLPFPGGDALVVVSSVGSGIEAQDRSEDWLARRDLFAYGARFAPSSATTIEFEGSFEVLRFTAVSARFWPLVGQRIPESEWREEGAVPLVLTHRAASALGEDVRIGHFLASVEGTAYRVVGLLPEAFVNPIERPGGLIAGFVPFPRDRLEDAHAARASLLVRPQRDVSPKQIETALAVSPRDGGGGAVATPLRLYLSEQHRSLMFLLLIGASIVAIACITNVASLLASSLLGRAADFRTRQALGATSADLWRLIVAEFLLIAGVCCCAIVAVAHGLLMALSLLGPTAYWVLGTPTFDARTLAVTLALAGATAAAAGGAAWGTLRIGAESGLRTVAKLERQRGGLVRKLMMGGQSAIAVTLVLFGILVSRSVVTLLQQDPGVDRDVMVLNLSFSLPPTEPQLRAQIEELKSLPGVVDATTTPGAIVDGGRMIGAYRPPTLDGQPTPAALVAVSDRFFAVVGARVREGRLPEGPLESAVANSSYAKSCCPDGTPLGRMFSFGRRSLVIVAVVDDIYLQSLDARPGPTVFVPTDGDRPRLLSHLIKLDPERPGSVSLSSIERIVKSHPGVEIRNKATLGARYMTSIGDRVVAATVSTLFAVTSLAIACTGIFATTALAVERRRSEFAIRLAVGAVPMQLRVAVMAETAAAVATGALVGTVGGILIALSFQELLYGVAPLEPTALASAIFVCLLSAIGAAWYPARRLVNLSPATLLKAD